MKPSPIRFRWKYLHLTDRCLLIFMFLLVAQAAYTLFIHEIGGEDSNSLDTVLRTTASAIFGYFVSGGTQSKDSDEEDTTSTTTSATTTRIGFQTEEDAPTARLTLSTQEESSATTATAPATVTAKPPTRKELLAVHHQTVIVSTIGIVALIVLMFARNFTVLNTSTIATLSQFRDFVSGSVGFLIGHGHKST